MDANALTPRDLFEGKDHYEIPAFQRPYVWNEEFQWAPLWDDVLRVASGYVATKLADPDASPDGHHFLGAVVYESSVKGAGDVTRHGVIDGQQRMTTLQLMLDAVHDVVAQRGHDDMAEALEEVIRNRSSRFAGKPERFKLWPSQADREAFVHAMEPTGPGPMDQAIVEGHQFFRREALEWVLGEPDDDGTAPAGSESLRVEALCSTLQDRLIVVAIDLTGHDDAQLIFETLNDRGTPLLKADLIKNWVFRKGEASGANVAGWAETYWSDFDTSWWRQEIRQGRLVRSRVDIFLQYWLTMRRQDEVKADNVFRVFVEYADGRMTTTDGADRLLRELRRDADTFRSFSELERDTPEGNFHHRVIERLELAAVTPVFLWLLSGNYPVPQDQRRVALEAVESWAIRRTLLRMTTKDVNRFVVAILKTLSQADAQAAGTILTRYLSKQTAETRVWPPDEVMSTRLPELKLYGNIRQDRLRVVLSAVEGQLRAVSTHYEEVALPDRLDIEHVMPRGWRTHWNTVPPLDPEAAAQRDHAINTLGNLTLVTRSLNSSLSNRPWTDAEAAGLKEGGRPDTGKRSLLDEFSLLVMNKHLLNGQSDDWTEEDIAHRSSLMTSLICDIWAGPDMEVQQAAIDGEAADQGSQSGPEGEDVAPVIPCRMPTSSAWPRRAENES